MAVTDPVDARLLAALAEVGKVAVHELAAKVGMDPREVAYRLVALSGSGLPLLVGVESDPNGLRAALAGAWSRPVPPPAVRPAPRPAPPPAPRPDPVMSTWGPPQTASWARGDQKQPPQRAGRIGEALPARGLDGEQLSVHLLEVQDPADFLFGAAGYRLEAGERAVIVHTEVINRGSVPFVSLPDNYLELVTAEGKAVTKAPVSLTSRPPYKIGVQPGETAGGHTVYVLGEATRIVSVRWSPRPEPDERTLTWTLD
ncbi:AsnC family protein [Amycolatopsis alkalitolerans]|uniref:AsnC family protein n=1 Tax=Amycolatopsis alkalitolerans TaxID=2547244 RepID=A0A5C4LUZ9_9PSEU|nr:AsnC family protein [Amycolatopsis alkalitolerans]TNC22667.1 AsnC family protein [Amycolatopsis alkalitolerans]